MSKPLTFFALLLLVFVFSSCSVDVDLYADYKDVPVVYGLLDAKADTNYIKITKSFCGSNQEPINAIEIAAISDSSNYPGKLEAYIVELQSASGQSYEPTGRMFMLDTITIHNKELGLFYAPHQKVYYTTERFNTNNEYNKYRYRLYVVKPDGEMVTSETSIVGGNVVISGGSMSFQATPSDAIQPMVFTAADEAVLYEFGMQFNYWEKHTGQPLVKKNVTWTYGARTLSSFEKVENTERSYRLYYSVNALFNELKTTIGNDTVWDVNHPNVERYMDDFIVFVAAAGEDFYNIYQSIQIQQNGLSISTEYNNINGGYGLFSSRIFVERKVTLSALTKFNLFQMPWGFKEW